MNKIINPIIERAVADKAFRVHLMDGKVWFEFFGDEKYPVDVSDDDYNALWQESHSLVPNDQHIIAPHFLPSSMQDSWSLRLYVGSRNVLFDLLDLKPKILSEYTEQDLLALIHKG